MKIKMLVTIMIIAFIVGCDGTPPVITPSQMWDSWVKLQEESGYKVLSVAKSEQWIENHRSKISIPDSLSFKEEYSVDKEAYRKEGTIITVDHNGKYRVIGKKILTLYEVKKYDWNIWENLQHKIGRKVLSVTESEQWIEDNRSKISIGNLTELSFLKLEAVWISKQIVFITVDHDGNHRVSKERFNPEPPPNGSILPGIGFLGEEESIKWLKNHGYQVVKIANGYTVKKKIPGFNFDNSLKGAGTIIIPLPEGGTLGYEKGKLHIQIDQ